MDHPSQLQEHQGRRARRKPPRECASCAHRGQKECRVLAHARCGRNGRRLQRVSRRAQGETDAWSCRGAAAAGAAGSTTWNVAPCPIVLSTHIVPPCASTMRREM